MWKDNDDLSCVGFAHGSKAWLTCLLDPGPDAIQSKIGLFKSQQTGKSDRNARTNTSSDYQLTKPLHKCRLCEHFSRS